MIAFELNGRDTQVDVDADTPLLWVLRDTLKMTGTKFGCGVAACGACTVHVDGQATRSCVLPIATVAGMKVRTIEALAPNDQQLDVLQQLWITHQVPQCGYCQSGMLMAASALFANERIPTATDLDDALTNICRCGTYPRIRQALQTLIEQRQAGAVVDEA